MALTISQADGQYQVSGVTSDVSVTSPLGSRYFTVGAHLIGFDDNFEEPIIVRAYYDPSLDQLALNALQRGTLQYIGYVQFMQLSFDGMPIPPSVYGGKLADRQPYVYDNDLRLVDFMGPADAALRGIATPFYAFNSVLTNGSLRRVSDFFYFGPENGSLVAAGNFGPNQALVATLFAEIAPGLVTPAELSRTLSDDDIVLVLSPTAQELAHSEPYRLALTSLKTTALTRGEQPPLAGLDESKVAAQVIGDYVLLTLPDPEDLGDTLVISTRPRSGGTDVVVHLIDDYTMTDLRQDAARSALLRIRDYELETGFSSMRLAEGPPSGRGRSGLSAPPYQFSPTENALELKYWTLAVAVRTTGPTEALSRRALTGVEWSALLQFDEDTGAMTLARVSEVGRC
jgi:hypothetical protein